MNVVVRKFDLNPPLHSMGFVGLKTTIGGCGHSLSDDSDFALELQRLKDTPRDKNQKSRKK